MKIKIAQFGLGPIGIETLKLAASKPWVEVVGGIDIDPAKVGKDLSEITGVKSLSGAKVYRSLDELPARKKPDVVFHTAVSKFKAAFAQIEPIVKRGISVVSSCEELLYPPLRDASLAKKLDALCRKNGARVLGTGVNPGFVMDLLPVCMTGVSRSVTAVHVQRVVNASTRREPLQRKIGSGQNPSQFQKLLNEGKAGHQGLKDSLALIGHALGWKVTNITERLKPVVAKKDIRTKFLSVKKGQACGIDQYAEGKVNGKVVITLDIKMYLDAENPHDAIQIEGEPPLKVIVDGGVAGDHATVAALVNAAPRVLAAQPGLLLMTEIAVPKFA